MNELIQSVERRQLRQVPEFRVGDRVRVHFQVVEGNRRRTQVFEGVVLKIQGKGSRRTFSVGVERTFPVHSPKIERIEVAARGEVRRAKLYYLRGRIGRRARVRESRDFRPEDVAMTAVPEPEAAVDQDGAGGHESAEEAAADAGAAAATEAEAPAEAEQEDAEPEPGEAAESEEAASGEPEAAAESQEEVETEGSEEAEPDKPEGGEQEGKSG